MTDEKVAEVLKSYREVLTANGAEPIRNSEEPNQNHLLWMVGEIESFMQEGRREKAMRWIGFIQGSFWAMKIRTVEEMKNDNRPDDSSYNKERV